MYSPLGLEGEYLMEMFSGYSARENLYSVAYRCRWRCGSLSED